MEPSSDITPGDLLDFIYLDEFENDWDEIYPDDPDEVALSELEFAITGVVFVMPTSPIITSS